MYVAIMNRSVSLLQNVVVSEAFEKLHEHINEERPNLPFLQVNSNPSRIFRSRHHGDLRHACVRYKHHIIQNVFYINVFTL